MFDDVRSGFARFRAVFSNFHESCIYITPMECGGELTDAVEAHGSSWGSCLKVGVV